jgi:hypothetical protein
MRLDKSISTRYQALIKKEFVRQEIDNDYLDQKFSDIQTVKKKNKTLNYAKLKLDVNNGRTWSKSKFENNAWNLNQFKDDVIESTSLKSAEFRAQNKSRSAYQKGGFHNDLKKSLTEYDSSHRSSVDTRKKPRQLVQL